MTNTYHIATQPSPLARGDIAQLRKADSMVFRAVPEAYSDGVTHLIEAYVERPHDQPDACMVYTVAGSFHLYDKDAFDQHTRRGYDTGYYHQSSAKYNPQLTTALSLLRAGDQVSLRWVGGNDNQYLELAGLHHDELHLVITRGKLRMQFLVGSTLTPNNFTRMVNAAPI